MSNSPTVSVIMANYNTKTEYLREAIDSILNQTFSDFELIIIDDCSTDDSPDFIKSYKDKRIVFIKNEKNSGAADTRNKGFKIAKGKYIAIMDSDDISLPERLEKQVKFMDRNPDLIACGTWFEKFGTENKVRKPDIEDFKYYRCQLLFYNTPTTMCHPSSMLRKSMLDEFEIEYDINSKAEDYRLWVECAKFARIDIVREVLVRYRTHETQISTAGRVGQAQSADAISNLQLESLGIDTQNDRISAWRRYTVSDVDDFFNAYNWLVSIRKANESKKIYNQDALVRFTQYMIEKYLKILIKKIPVIYFKGNSEIRGIINKLAVNRIKH